VHGQGRPDADSGERTQHGQTRKEDGPTAARLVLTVPERELMAKEIDAFVVANLIKAQPGGERLFESLQRWLLHPGEKSSGGKEHPGCSLSFVVPYRGADLIELVVGEPLGFVEDEEQSVRLGGVRYRYRPATCGQRCHDRAGAGHLLGCEFRPARDAYHLVTRPCQLAQSLREKPWVSRRIAGDENKATLAA